LPWRLGTPFEENRLRHTRPLRSSTLALAALLALPAANSLQAATLIVANKSEATVSLVDLPGGKIVATLPVGEGPHEVGVSPDGKLALVANYGTGPKPGSTLTLLDVPNAKVVKTIDLGEYRRPHGLTWADGRRALVTSEANKALLVVDVQAGKVARAIPTGQEASHMVAASADGSRAYVANIVSGSMTAIDLKTGRALGSVPTAAGAEGIDVTPDGKQVWVANNASHSVTVVDAATLKVIGTLESPGYPIRSKVTPDGKWVLVSNAQSGDLSVFSVADRKLARRLQFDVKPTEAENRMLGEFKGSSVPIGVLIDPEGRHAYVAHAVGDRISVIDLKDWKVTGTLAAGKEPDGMGYSKLDVKAGQKPGPQSGR
jgi:YVTN family beta-propeller protein